MMLLPSSLLLLLYATIVLAQSRQQLSVNSLNSFSPASLPNPPSFTIPTTNTLTVTVALCSDISQSLSPRFFVTNSSAVPNPGSDGGPDVFEIELTDGHGIWTGSFSEGGAFAVENVNQTTFEVGLSDNISDPVHQILIETPLLGDTTAGQVLIFSSPFLPPSPAQLPVFPNYTLPPANISFPVLPSSVPNFTLIIAPTSSSPSLTSLPQTGCRLGAVKSTGLVVNETTWLRDDKGWRNQWLVGELTPLTNYTSYVVQNGTKVSGPIYFVTKSALFICPLVTSLPYCPTVSYAVPLAAPPFPSTVYDSTNLPLNLTSPLLEYMTNLTTTLLTFACGRDLYSPLKSCADCQAAYRTWLCTIYFTRCSEASPGSITTVSPPAASDTGLSAAFSSGAGQVPLSALVPQPTFVQPRNPFLPALNTDYTALLPCLETCTAVDRACPNFLGFKCPLLQFNAAASYGVGYIDSGKEGEEGGGVVKQVVDQWGNVWCNGI